MHTIRPPTPVETVRILVSRRMGIKDLVIPGDLFKALGETCDPFHFRFVSFLVCSYYLALFA
jgi:hypothetical protein